MLAVPVLAAGWGIAAAGLAVGLKKTPAEKISKVAVLSAVLFLISLVRVPVGPASVHLTLLGLMGALLGWSVIPALFTALLLQALLFQFGGIAVLGVNTVTLGTAAMTGYVVFRAMPRRVPAAVTGFLTGCIAVLAGSALLVTALFLSDGNFVNTAKLIFVANIPLALVEGVFTLFMLAFLKRMLPEYVQH